MTKYKRYYKKDYDELYYIFDSKILSEKEFEEKVEYDDYALFANSLTAEEILSLLNENARLKSAYKVLHTQFQDLKKFLENNLNEYWTREKPERQIIKLSDENEELKKEIKVYEDMFNPSCEYQDIKIRCNKYSINLSYPCCSNISCFKENC